MVQSQWVFCISRFCITRAIITFSAAVITELGITSTGKPVIDLHVTSSFGISGMEASPRPVPWGHQTLGERLSIIIPWQSRFYGRCSQALLACLPLLHAQLPGPVKAGIAGRKALWKCSGNQTCRQAAPCEPSCLLGKGEEFAAQLKSRQVLCDRILCALQSVALPLAARCATTAQSISR